MINLDELEAIARAATPGPWRIQALEGLIPGMIDELIYEPNGRVVAQNFDRQDRDHLNPENNAAYIAAANPQAILELIADYKRLQFDVVNLLFRDKFAKEIIEPLALEGNPRARFWMAGFGRKIAIDEPPRPEPLQHFAEYVLGMDSWCKHLESTGGIHPTIALQLRQAAENALQGHPPLWMAHWERRAKKLERDYKQLESVNNDAQRLIIEQQQTIARLRTELAARTPPPAVAPYHRLDDIRQLPPPTINATAEAKLFKEVWIGVTTGSAAYIESLYERWLKHGDWIPCDEAMPFDGMPVLVAVEGEYVSLGGIWHRGRWETWEEGKEYQHLITHWLPLPRLPFDGEDDEYQL